MKNLGLLILLVTLLASCGSPENKETQAMQSRLKVIKVKGSETVRPFVEKAIELYERKNPEVVIDYTGGGSNLGLMSLKQNESDLIFTSKKFEEDELKDFPKDKTIVTDALAYDALCVIVSIKNPISELSTVQLADIYSGRVKNWKDLNGRDEPIQLYSRDVASGSYSFFKDKILANDSYSSEDINLVHNDEIVRNVRDNQNAIGYVGLGDVIADVKPIKIKEPNGTEYVAPAIPSVKNKSYYLSRELGCMYYLESGMEVKEFVEFLKSPECQEIINEVGFLSK